MLDFNGWRQIRENQSPAADAWTDLKKEALVDLSKEVQSFLCRIQSRVATYQESSKQLVLKDGAPREDIERDIRNLEKVADWAKSSLEIKTIPYIEYLQTE